MLSPTPTSGLVPRTDTLVDAGVLDGLADMLADLDTVRELAHMLVDSLPGRLQALEAGERAGDTDRVRRTAHALKSAARQLGAGALADVAAAVEAGRADVAALEPLVAPTCVELLRWCGDGEAVSPTPA